MVLMVKRCVLHLAFLVLLPDVIAFPFKCDYPGAVLWAFSFLLHVFKGLGDGNETQFANAVTLKQKKCWFGI